ncbi:MAG: phosphoribosylformylglycinamidine synthase [Coriobacteriales bacterium]|jgi:phosphoribosylformylglycinamidine synthase
MVRRVYVEKKTGFDVEARQLLRELRDIVGIVGLSGLRLVNRYDVEGISDELFESCVPTVFSEPQTDVVTYELPLHADEAVFAVEYLPGQFDMRANSASECVQLISQGERPEVRSAKVYLLSGRLTDADVEAVKRYVINPVEAREASLAARDTLKMAMRQPGSVETMDGFTDLDEQGLRRLIDERGLAMDLADLEFCQRYFSEEGRDPTITEIRVIDTYWSDHCRHTTFHTQLDDVRIDDDAVRSAFERYQAVRHELGRDDRPVCLMDMGTLGARYLKSRGVLRGLDESEEVNACTVKVKVDVDGHDEDWLYLFKNETHNHPTEIEPFGGAATCIGGCIRDPLSGRSYVYQAMRVTGAADPLAPVSQTLPGKLPQRKIVTAAAAGYSSYGNQIGLATGQVSELYHPGYVAKRMEIGAVVGATPADHVRRERPVPGDVVVLLGGRTGRDGIGGATGSSKEHNVESLETCGAEVQKGNAPEERKIQRLFRRKDACRLIKRCNDFGAGGVSVAIGELADGLYIDLDRVPKKYEGLDGTELAISESQERMACVVAADDADRFLSLAREENLEATVVARVTDDERVRMVWGGATIVDVSREFLSSNGAPKHQVAHVERQGSYSQSWAGATLEERMLSVVTDLNVCSNKGLSERFDSTIGASTVLMPFGGARQLTAPMAMVAKLPVGGETTTCSGMAWGFNPYLMDANQFTGAYLSVVESICKLVAAGFEHERAYLTFQEYFESLRDEPRRWGKPVAALLGALMAQLDLGIGSIGGKDSMSGSFEDLDVPPTLVSFATAVGSVGRVTSPEFKRAGSRVILLSPDYGADGITPEPGSLLATLSLVERLIGQGSARAVATAGYGDMAEEVFKMCLGNHLGIELDAAFDVDRLFTPAYGSFVVELEADAEMPEATGAIVESLGVTTGRYSIVSPAGQSADLGRLQQAWESKLEPVFPYRGDGERVRTVTSDAPTTRRGARCPRIARPRVVIPVFPGNNCEFDSARAFERAGADVTTLVINNLTPQAVSESAQALVRAISNSQIVMIPGGFSGGDEPDGSAKFITAFFRSPAVTEAVRDLLQARDGLMLGICNGFQALVKLGLVPFGDIRAMDEGCPTLTFNTIGRHQSRLVRTRVCSTLSPWLSRCEVGDVHTIAISHGEGRFVASDDVLAGLEAGGQIATQYVDEQGEPGMSLDVNPNGSALAVEAITSPDGRVLGKMGHSERIGRGVYKNVPGDTFQPLFEGGVAYFAD